MAWSDQTGWLEGCWCWGMEMTGSFSPHFSPPSPCFPAQCLAHLPADSLHTMLEVEMWYCNWRLAECFFWQGKIICYCPNSERKRLLCLWHFHPHLSFSLSCHLHPADRNDWVLSSATVKACIKTAHYKEPKFLWFSLFLKHKQQLQGIEVLMVWLSLEVPL